MPGRVPRFRPGQRFGVRDEAGRLVLDAEAARFLTELSREVARLGHVSARPPLAWAEEPARRLVVELPPQIWAKLAGAGAPYDFTEQVYGAGVWTDKVGGRTGQAYEANATPGLAGEVAGIGYEGTANEWRFQRVTVYACDWTFAVRGCNSTALAGEVVAIKQGGITVATGTTDDGTGGTTLGEFTVSLPPGTYDYEIAASDGFAVSTGTITHSCPAGASTVITRTADANHVCVTKCAYPIPKTLHMSNGLGAHTFTYSGVSGGTHAWAGPTVTVTSATQKWDSVLGTCVSDGGACLMQMVLNYNGGAASFLAGWGYFENWGAIACSCGPGNTGSAAYAAGSSGGSAGGFTATTATCRPFSVDMAIPAPGATTSGAGCFPTQGAVSPNPAGGGTYTFTP